MAASAAPVVPETIRVGDVFGTDDVRVYPDRSLPPDMAYCLDAEMEFGGIGGDERAFADLFMPDAVAWFNSISHDGPGFASRLADRYGEWRLDASADDALAADWAGLEGLRMLMEDAVLGIRSDLGDEADTLPEDGILARLATQADAQRVSRRAGTIVARCLEDIARWGGEAFLAGRGRTMALYEARKAALDRRDALIRAGEARRIEGRRTEPRLPTGRELRAASRKERLSRRVLSRSFALLEGLVGRPRAKAWLSGDTVNVEGRRFDFRLRVKDVRQHGHGALDVSVTDKDGVMLAMLCVYAPETPALDQVAGLLLYVVSGEEDEILRKANVIIATEAADRHVPFNEVRGNRKDEALREVGRLIADLEGESRRIVAHTAARNALSRHLAAGALAPLVAALGGPGHIAGVLPGLERAAA